MRDEGDRPPRSHAGPREGPRERERHGDTARVVEGAAEPAVVVAGDDARRPTPPPSQHADDVRRQRPARKRRLQHDPYPLPRAQASRVLLPDRDCRRPLAVPESVEGPERARRLVVGPALRRGDEERRGAAQAELERDVVGPEPVLAPADKDHAASDLQAFELPPPGPSSDDELAAHPARRRPGDAAERRALVPPPAGLDVRVEQPPPVDRDRPP